MYIPLHKFKTWQPLMPGTWSRDRPLLIDALPEIGSVTVQPPEAGTDRPELVMAPGGSGEWESALHALLGLAGHGLPASAVILDSGANEALVLQQSRWWAPEDLALLPASEDSGVGSELLATCQTLGDVSIDEESSDAHEAIIEALASVGDWRFSPRWLLETSDPADATLTLSVARAAVAAWASDGGSGLAVYVYGAALNQVEGVFAAPGPLHSYVLVAHGLRCLPTRSAASTGWCCLVRVQSGVIAAVARTSSSAKQPPC